MSVLQWEPYSIHGQTDLCEIVLLAVTARAEPSSCSQHDILQQADRPDEVQSPTRPLKRFGKASKDSKGREQGLPAAATMELAAFRALGYTPACTERMHTARGTFTTLPPAAAMAPASQLPIGQQHPKLCACVHMQQRLKATGKAGLMRIRT